MKYLFALLIITSIGCETAVEFIDFNKNGVIDIYEDPRIPFDDRVDDLVFRLTLDEKIAQMESYTPSIERLGIPKFNWMNEALHGVRAEGYNTTVFPISIALGATWNEDLAFRQGKAISDEARALANIHNNALYLDFWTPVINMGRDPRWGRTQEGYGEDPFLVSSLAYHTVKGLQGDHERYLKVIASPKHFVANNSEFNRHTGSSNVSEKVLRDYYLPAFKRSIVDAKAHSIMSAYNALNGIPCTANERLLQEILRDEWGFEGFVVSDCGAIADVYENHKYASTPEAAVAMSLKAGTDLNCGSYYRQFLLNAVNQGLVDESTIDKSVKRLFKARMLLGLFDPINQVPFTDIAPETIESTEHQALAKKIALESIVLLKNENGFLPLDKNISSIAVIGPNANQLQFGNYSGTASFTTTPLQGIRNKVSKSTDISTAQGTPILLNELPAIPAGFFRPRKGSKESGIYAEYFDNVDFKGIAVANRIEEQLLFNYGFDDVPHPSLTKNNWSVRYSGFFLPDESTRFMFHIGGVDGIKFSFNDSLIVDKMSENYSHTTFVTKPLIAGKEYPFYFEYAENEGWQSGQWGMKKMEKNMLANAVKLASEADYTIIVAGTYHMIEAEDRDRDSLDLPADQRELIQKVIEVNPNTCLVLVNGSPLAINWAKQHVPAIVEAWYPGQAGGEAIADVLFGDYNPGGKLPMTFYKGLEQLPAFDDYDITKGRTYLYLEEEPLYPFGYGLSYTEFSFSGFSINQRTFKKGDSIQIDLQLNNVGDRVGDEVVQLYIEEPSYLKNAAMKLKAFKRVTVEPDLSVRLSFSVPVAELASYNEDLKDFDITPGTYIVKVGNSSSNFFYSQAIEVK